MTDALHAPAAARNAAPITEILARVLPPRGLVLEIASGSGEHAVHFARALPGLVWQPSDPDVAARRSILAHASAAGLAGIRAPLAIDAARPPWPVTRAEAVVAINLIHIAPWEATTGLMAGAGAVLADGGVLVLYGPFREGGRHTTPSNAAFDDGLRARNPAWGVRDLEAVAAVGAAHGLPLAERVPMPANNLGLIFRRAARSPAADGGASP